MPWILLYCHLLTLLLFFLVTLLFLFLLSFSILGQDMQHTFPTTFGREGPQPDEEVPSVLLGIDIFNDNPPLAIHKVAHLSRLEVQSHLHQIPIHHPTLDPSFGAYFGPCI